VAFAATTLAAIAPGAALAAAPTTFSYTDGVQTYTVPAGVSALSVTAVGATGGTSDADGSPGGQGAVVDSDVPVTPGQTLYVYVGGNGAGGASTAGGFNGGGNASGYDGGASGGGASDIRTTADDPTTRLLVAAGGGGGGSGYDTSAQGGSAGNPNGQDGGGTDGYGCGGSGATQSAGGSGGCSSVGGGGADGSLGQGGQAGLYFYWPYEGAGGGGGGYYGGGGGGGGAIDQTWHETGAGAGGGGGASYLGSTGALVTDEGRASNGEVVITYQVAQPPAFTADSPPTAGGVGTAYSYQFAASGTPAPTFSLSSGAPSWLAVDSSTGAVTGTPPAGTTSFSYSVTASNEAGSVTAGPFQVTVSAKADVTAALSCPAGLTVGASGTCTLTVANNGPALATKVAAGAVVPANLTVTGCSDGCSQLGGALGWSLGSLPAGQSDALTISITATHAGTALVTAADGAATPDPNLLDNLAAATVKITR